MVTFIKPTTTQAPAQPAPQPAPRTVPRINLPSASNQTAQQSKPDYAATQASVSKLVTVAATQTTQTTPPPNDPLAKPVQDSKVNEVIMNALASLDAALEARAPDMAQYIAIIHKNMREDPAQVVLMSDEERGIFFRGLKSVTQQEIIATTKGKRASKAVTSISLDDI